MARRHFCCRLSVKSVGLLFYDIIVRMFLISRMADPPMGDAEAQSLCTV